MDPYERFVRALNFEEPDRVAIMDNIDNPDVFREFGGSGPLEEVVPRTYSRLGIDSTRFPVSVEEEYSQIDLQPSKTRTWEDNRFGYLLCEKPFTFRILGGNLRSHPPPIDRPFKTINDLTDLEFEPLSETEIQKDYFEGFMREKKLFDKYGMVYYSACPMYIFSHLPDILGWPLFIRALYTAKDALLKLMDKLTLVCLAVTKAYPDTGVPTMMYGDDIAYKHGLLVNPDFLRKEWIPRVKKVIAPLKKKGVKVIYHSDGNLWKILDDIVEMGADAVQGLEGMDIGKVKEQYGDKLVLLGNLDIEWTLPLGSTSDVERETVDCIRKAAPGSGYCLGSSSSIRPGIPVENITAIFKTAKHYSKYPLRVNR